jgi:hypothetical protein
MKNKRLDSYRIIDIELSNCCSNCNNYMLAMTLDYVCVVEPPTTPIVKWNGLCEFYTSMRDE